MSRDSLGQRRAAAAEVDLNLLLALHSSRGQTPFSSRRPNTVSLERERSAQISPHSFIRPAGLPALFLATGEENQAILN